MESAEKEQKNIDEKSVLPYPAELLSKELLARQNATNHPQKVVATKEEFERIFEKLHSASNAIIRKYRERLGRYNLNPGEIRLYMLGGRVRGAPLEVDSDLDLYFCVERPLQSANALLLNRFEDPTDALLFRNSLQEQILKDVSKICEELGIPNKFHILSFGNKLPPDSMNNSEKSLLVSIDR